MAVFTDGFESEKSKKERELVKEFDSREQVREETKTKKAIQYGLLGIILVLSLTGIFFPEVLKLAGIIVVCGFCIGSVLAIVYLIFTKKGDGTEETLFAYPFLFALLISTPLAFVLNYMGITL